MASERILSKEEIETALNERHSPEKQKLLSAGQVTIAGLGGLGSNVAYSYRLCEGDRREFERTVCGCSDCL